MKKCVYLSLLVWISAGLYNCHSEFDGPTAFSVSGVYQLIWYTRASLSDDNPSGTIQVIQIDEEHINLIIQGRSGKTKMNYTYNNVDVTITNDSGGQVTYNLTYKKHIIGTARVDGVSRYLILTPSANLRLEGLEI